MDYQTLDRIQKRQNYKNDEIVVELCII